MGRRPTQDGTGASVTSPLDRRAWMAIGSILVAGLVMAIKYEAYRRTGSVALYSDALESIVNVVTAVAALIALQISAKPADGSHQFGHHKAEYFSAVLEGVLIVIAALLIIREAYDALLHPRTLTTPREGMIINGIAGVINAGWCAVLIIGGRKLKSPALVADGWHLLTDVATSVGVLFGLVMALVTGWMPLDPLMAVLVAVNILWAGWRLMRESVSSLMDASVDAGILASIKSTIAENATGAIEVHDLKTRMAGRATFVEFHLVVPGAMTVAAAHQICDRLEEALSETLDGAKILIHVEPEGEAQHKGIVVL